VRGPRPRARGHRPARCDCPLRPAGLHLRLSLVGVERAKRRAGGRGARGARRLARLSRLPDVLRLLDELVPVRALRLRDLLPGLGDARAAGDSVNEPVGVLRLVDPFRAAEAWVPVAPRGYRVAVEQISWPPRAADVTRIAAAAAREGARIAGGTLAESRAIRAADAVMCHSREEGDLCVRREAIAAERVCVVHPGVDVSRFVARVPEATPLLVAVGALFARNRHLDLLQA